jgi:hypothetical protein
MKLAQRVFSQTDQEQFAAASGDRNPMHMDALQARRTQAGAPVVHGVHLLLWALDSLAAAQPDLPPLSGLDAHFNRFVYLEERVEVVLTKQGPTSARLSIVGDEVLRTKITIAFGAPEEGSLSWPSSNLPLHPSTQAVLNRSFEQLSGLAGLLPFSMTPQEAERLFPSATKWLSASRIAALASSSNLVGMVCPGLHSIYAGLSFRSCGASAPQNHLAFRVMETDPRFQSAEMEIAGGGFFGAVRSFVRTPPVEQASMAALATLVGPKEFAGSVALIVGGSRGLGELTAKLIATGGGQVIVTWNTGRADAERVADEIQSAGGRCKTLAYNARRPSAEQLEMLSETPTHAYYFATPNIYRAQSEIFVAERLKEFETVYVDGFWQLARDLRGRQPNISLFYPSTVYVTERPQGMTEYAMAKSAGEVLCAEMNRSLAPLHVEVRRLPRLPTDQTASVMPAETTLPIEVMLPIIRDVQSWPR